MRKRMAKRVTWCMAVMMLLIGITPRVDAAFSPSEGVSLLTFDRQSDLQKIQKVLETKMVSERLKDLGFTRDEIQSRLNLLDDQQIHQMAVKVEELQVGGDGAGVVIALLVIVILAIIIYFLLGHRVVVR